MALAELIDDREQIFARPKRVTDITERKQLIRVDSFDRILPALERRTRGQAIVIGTFDIIPAGYRSAQNFSKRGPVVELDTFGGNEQRLIEEKWDPLRARIQADESGKYPPEKGPYIGWMWTDPENNAHIVRPTTVLEGHRLHMLSVKSGRIQDRIKFKDYGVRDSHLQTVRAFVPSRSEKRKHEVVIEHVTHFDDLRKHAEWTRLRTRHECGFKANDFTFRFPRCITYCPHDVAAYLAHSRRVYESNRLIPQPFPLFSEQILRAFIGAAYHTVKVEAITKRGKLRLRSRPLTFPEIDPILMDAWANHGNRSTFFVYSPTKAYKSAPPIGKRRTMRQYNWSTDTSGMPFPRP